MRQELACDFYIPAQPKASVVIVHGMAEHRQRYDKFAQFLEQNGYAVALYDLPGHGVSCLPADYGWFGAKDGWQNLVDSAHEMLRIMKERVPDKPVFLFGHSMGSMIARCLLQETDTDFDGLILSGAPCYPSAAPIAILLAKAVRINKGAKGHSSFLDNLMTGGFGASVPDPRTPFDWLSYNTENVDRYMADPLDGFPFTVQGYIDEITGCIRMHDVKRYHCTRGQLPIYFFAGEDDPCTGGRKGLEDSMLTLRKAGYSNIRCQCYEHMRHETLQEADCLLVMQDVVAWLDDSHHA